MRSFRAGLVTYVHIQDLRGELLSKAAAGWQSSVEATVPLVGGAPASGQPPAAATRSAKTVKPEKNAKGKTVSSVHIRYGPFACSWFVHCHLYDRGPATLARGAVEASLFGDT